MKVGIGKTPFSGFFNATRELNCILGSSGLTDEIAPSTRQSLWETNGKINQMTNEKICCDSLQ